MRTRVSKTDRILAESKRFERQNQLISVDVDLEALIHDRMVTNSFGDCAREHQRNYRRIPFSAPTRGADLQRDITAHPFLPANPSTLATRTWEIFEIQVNALATRLAATGIKELVLGVSGGLDSTQAALVAAAAMDTLDLPRENLLCVTMPARPSADTARMPKC